MTTKRNAAPAKVTIYFKADGLDAILSSTVPLCNVFIELEHLRRWGLQIVYVA